MVVGGLLRGWAASWGFISDEICWLFNGGVYTNWAAGETAVNPPAIRMVLAAITTDHWQIAHMGRAWSFAAGTGAIGLMFWLGRLVGNNKNLPGFLAASYLTVLPLAIQQAGQFRSYATLVFVLTWHLIALVKVVDGWKGPPRRSWVGHLVVSAALLPQVHYTGVAVVFLEGLTFAVWLRDRRFLRYYVPAALLFAPLGYRIVTETNEHLAPDVDRLQNLAMLFQVVLHHPFLTVLVVLGWIRFQGRQRILLLGAVSSAGGLIAVASYHLARPDLGIIPTTYQIPLMATLPLVIPTTTTAGTLGRVVAWIAMLGAFLLVAVDGYSRQLRGPRAHDGPPLMARDVQAGHWPSDRPTYLYPPSTVQPVHFYLKYRRLLDNCPTDEGPFCFEYRGRLFTRFNERDIPSSYVVLFSVDGQEERFADQCRLARAQPTYWVWDCPNGWKAPVKRRGSP